MRRMAATIAIALWVMACGEEPPAPQGPVRSPIGAACRNSDECASGCCSLDNLACRALQEPKVGYCTLFGVGKTPGEGCRFSQECASQCCSTQTDSCSPDAPSSATCVESATNRAAGEPCGLSSECASGCCNAFDHKCASLSPGDPACR